MQQDFVHRGWGFAAGAAFQHMGPSDDIYFMIMEVGISCFTNSSCGMIEAYK